MVRFLLLSIVLGLIIYFFWKRKPINSNSDKYKIALFLLIFLTLIFLIITQGKFILPKLFQLIKIALPFITKLIA